MLVTGPAMCRLRVQQQLQEFHALLTNSNKGHTSPQTGWK